VSTILDAGTVARPSFDVVPVAPVEPATSPLAWGIIGVNVVPTGMAEDGVPAAGDVTEGVVDKACVDDGRSATTVTRKEPDLVDST
jgi:hypothetical protein